LSENYPDLKRLIQQSQKEGFATLAT
jgi:hypothetical protein